MNTERYWADLIFTIYQRTFVVLCWILQRQCLHFVEVFIST